MADRIKLLPEVVANQIAAGEVVNRPSSVVKEMMENAVDAGASSVKVNFRDGGKELIQIVDDGCGMSPVDARLAFDRHATSKIQSVDDIYALRTFGFRGEALASIAAVAEVELRSRQEGDEYGTKTEINGGEFVGQSPVMCPVGSQFFVRNLFYNVPARRRFLDRSTTSASHIKTEFRRVALCYPEIAFELYANDAPVYALTAGTLANRIVEVVGRHIKHNLLEVGAETSIASITGYIGRPAAAKRRNSEQYLFVNGRYFKSPYLVSAILKAYEKLMPANTQPSFFLYLTIDASRVDVNVHPQKTEVKFSDEEAVWQIVNAAVRETLAKTGAVPMMDFDEEKMVDIPVLSKGGVYTEPRAMNNSSYNPFDEGFVGGGAFNPTESFTGFDLPSSTVNSASSSGEEFEDLPSEGVKSEFGISNADFGLSPHEQQTMEDGMVEDRSYKLPVAEDDVEGEMSEDFEEVGSQMGGSAEDVFEEVQSEMGGVEIPHAGAGDASQFEDYPSGGGRGVGGGSTLGDSSNFGGGAGFGGASEGRTSAQAAKLTEKMMANLPDEFEDFESDDGFTEIASGEEESVLQFVASEMEAQVQQLDMGLKPEFSHAIPLAGGCVAALLGGRLVVVDGRRAKERILYEEYLKMLGHGSSVSQQLLFPERLVLSNDEYALLEEHAVDFAALGFDLDFQGEGAIELKGTPAEMPADAVDQLLFELLQAFAMPVDLEQMRKERIAAAMARQGAKSLPRKLQREEAAAMLRQLAEVDNFSFSPSGKAVLAEITAEDIRMKLG